MFLSLKDICIWGVRMENENKRFKLYEHKDNDYILDNPNEHLDFIEMLGDALTSEEIVNLLNELHEEKELLKKELSEQGTQLDFLKDENIHMRNVLNENEQLKQQMQRLYNYFADWFDDIMPSCDFSEMWDCVKEDEKWN